MGNSASSLPYTIGKQVAAVNHGWTLHEGSQKSDGAAVSVFTAKKPALAKTPIDKSRNPNLMQLTPALWHYMNCKKLRHPYILAVYATHDTDHPTTTTDTASSSATSLLQLAQAASQESGDFMIVTEPCIPLEHWLATRPPPEQIAWGLECIVRALHFLHASANLSHGSVCPESFYVTPAGDVKLWNFAVACAVDPASGTLAPQFVDYEALVTPMSYRSPERIEQRYGEVAQVGGTHAMDSYSVAVLAQHLFGGTLPMPLTKAAQRMQTPNIRMRPRLQPLLKCPIFDTPYQKLQLQLETFAVLSVEEKIPFWQTMHPQMQAQLIPEAVILYKLLPMMKSSIVTICTSDMLKQQEVYRKEGVCVSWFSNKSMCLCNFED
jgi:SCY1-like protein 1